MKPIDQIRSQAHEKSVFFRLSLRQADGRITTYPSGDDMFGLGQLPIRLAPANYDILYYDAAGIPLPSRGAKLDYAYAHGVVAPNQSPEVELIPRQSSDLGRTARPHGFGGAASARDTGGSPRSRGVDAAAGSSAITMEVEWKQIDLATADASEDEGADEDDEEDDDEADGEEEEDGGDQRRKEADEGGGRDGQGRSAPDASLRAGGGPAPQGTRPQQATARTRLQRDDLVQRQHERELLHVKLQLDAQERTSRLLKDTGVNKELADSSTLNGLMRREMVESQRIATMSARHIYDFEREALRGLRQDVLANLDTTKRIQDTFWQMADERDRKLRAGPPPATDYTGLGTAALNVLGKIATTLIESRQPVTALAARGSSDTQIATAPPAKPGETSASDMVAAVNAPAPPTKTKAQRVLAKLAAMDEVAAMASATTPEGLMALFERVNATIDDEGPQ